VLAAGASFSGSQRVSWRSLNLGESSVSTKRNVLFISADQWRADCLSVMGHQTVKTPQLDALAADGVLFSQHFCQAAPCGPARASMLTGLYAMKHRSILNGTPLAERHTNLALEVRKLGYDPILFGYTDTSLDTGRDAPGGVNLADRYMGVLPGFRVGVTYTQEMFLPWFSYLADKGYKLPENALEVYLGRSKYPGANRSGRSYAAPIYDAADSDTAYTTNKVLEYLQASQDQPWFVHAVFLRPHPPLFAPEPYNGMFDPKSVPFPQRLSTPDEEARQHPFLRFWLEKQSRPGSYPGHNYDVQNLPDYEIRQMVASYYGLIAEVDDHVGRLIDYLKSSNQLDNTLIIFTCDHGEQLGDHWLWDKGGYFDQSYHIPLIIRDPRTASARGRKVESFTEAVDILPTILDWLGAPTPQECDGRSLLPWLEGERPNQWRDFVHWEYDFRDPRTYDAEKSLNLASEDCTLNVIRDRQYKYVHFAQLPPLLFDLAEDPFEFDNKAEDRKYQPVMLTYAQKLLSLRMRHAERTLANTLLSPQGIFEHRGPRLASGQEAKAAVHTTA